MAREEGTVKGGLGGVPIGGGVGSGEEEFVFFFILGGC